MEGTSGPSTEKVNSATGKPAGIPVVDIVLSVLTIAGFIAGIVACSHYPGIGVYADKVMNGLVDGYTIVAPVVIFGILAPMLSQVLNLSEQKTLIVRSFLWLARKRLVACLYGAVVAAVLFKLPLCPSHSVNCLATFTQTFKTLGYLMTHSPFFYALYISVIAAFLSLRLAWLRKVFEHMVNLIEWLGAFFSYLVPALMFAMGAYVCQLPVHIKETLPAEAVEAGKGLAFTWLGGTIQMNGAEGAIKVYLLLSILVGAACLVFYAFLLLFARLTMPRFSIANHFFRYWLKVYPLLWATSSESLAMPLNLALVKELYPEVPSLLRRFVVGMGSWLNINGTLICVFVMAGAVATLLGQPVSLFELILAIPAVFLIGYGVPGMPGELIIFAGPVAMLLGLPAGVSALFVTLYVGFNFGLTDSFRSGHNSTDNCLSALMLSMRQKELTGDPLKSETSD